MKKTIMTSIVGLLIALGFAGSIVEKDLHAQSIEENHIDHKSDNRKDTKAKNVVESKTKLEKKESKAERFKKVEKKAKKAPEKKTKSATTSKKTITMEATAYTASCTGCSGITRTGINLKSNPNQKVIAVDPNVIPLGSKVYVEGYGTAIAGDTGGDIKGNRIDVFIPHRPDALNFGRRTVKVTVLG